MVLEMKTKLLMMIPIVIVSAILAVFAYDSVEDIKPLLTQ
jgi:hypothetical protein